MKISAFLALLIFALVSSTVAYDNDICEQKPFVGHAGGRHTCGGMSYLLWTYYPEENECFEFPHTACEENDNLFDSYDDCAEACID